MNRLNRTVQIEQQIASLAPSIAARESSRDTTLERVTEASTRSRGQRLTAQSIIIASAVVVAISPLIGEMTRIEIPRTPSSNQVNAKALRDAELNRQTFGWSLADVFYRGRLKRPSE